jgi:sulfite reductase (ferredoxin)
LIERPPELDLTGVPCPLNWAKAKVRLEALADSESLVLLVDDPRAVRDIPRAAETEGYDVLEVSPLPSGWRIVIQR